MKPCRYAPLEHPLVQQFQRAIDSLTAALAPASVRQYRAVARCFLIYLGDQHPVIRSLDQLRRDPHILGWLALLRSQIPPLATITRANYVIYLRACWENSPGPSNSQPLLICSVATMSPARNTVCRAL